MYNASARYLNLPFTFRRLPVPLDAYNQLLVKTAGQCTPKTTSSAPLNEVKPISSQSVRLNHISTKISKTVDCGRQSRRFMPPPRRPRTRVFLDVSLPSWGVQRMMSTIPAYLLEQKKRFLTDNGNSWTIVMGNEAGDLDSLASSIGFAWLLSHIPAADSRAIALIRTPREDFVLRAENIYALHLAGIEEDFQELLCPEDLPNTNLCTTFALVDHNSLHATYALPGTHVSAVVDHHEDEGKYLDTASPRIVEPAGSCSSLVTRLIMSYPTLQIPPEIASLLLSAIVIDTHGLKKGGKATDVDYLASGWLLPRVNVPPSENLNKQTVESSQAVHDNPWIQSLAHILSAKKTTISHLSTRDLLRRDYKEYDFSLSSSINGNSPRSIKAGLATVPLSLSTFFSPSPPSAIVATEKWIEERGLSVLGVLTAYKNKYGKSRRELVWVVDENVCGSKLSQALFDGFERDEVLHVKRTKFGRYGFGKDRNKEDDVDRESDDGEESAGEEVGTSDTSPFRKGLAARVYKQKNATATRKQVAPILRRLLEG